MAVYLRAAAFGLSTNCAIKDSLMGAIPHSRCYGKVIPTRSLPEYTNKYTKSSEAMMSDVNSSRNDLPSRCDVVANDKQSNKQIFGLELPDSLQKNMIHSSSVYAKIKELAPMGSCRNSQLSDSLSIFQVNNSTEIVDLISSSEEKDGHSDADVPQISTNSLPLYQIASGESNSEDNTAVFNTRSLLRAAECTGCPITHIYQPQSLVPGLVLRDYQVC